MTQTNNWECFCAMPCHSHTFLVTTPGAGMFSLSLMQLLWPTKARFVRAHWLAHLQLLLAVDYSEGGSQEKWLLFHVLINLEVTVQRGCFWLHSPVEWVTRIQQAFWYKCVLWSTFARHRIYQGIFTACQLKVPSVWSDQAMLARNEQRATIPKHIIHKTSSYDTNL